MMRLRGVLRRRSNCTAVMDIRLAGQLNHTESTPDAAQAEVLCRMACAR